MAGEHLPPLLVICGPTAIGKTGLAIHIAQQLHGEIVGADSRQIYRHMDIGTAKPTLAQRREAVHHLVDFVDPDQDYTLADYQEDAYAAINQITAENKLPILCGGTGQYITAVVEGWSIPRVEPDEALRSQLEAEAEQTGRHALHARLQSVDPAAAEKIHPNDLRRVVRALEVYTITGTPISTLQRKQPPPYRIRTLCLTMERDTLYARADQRVDMMMEAGFLAEVERLLTMGYDPALPSMSALGYRELSAQLAGELTPAEAVERTKLTTHDFIRRQEIWFRGHDHQTHWLDMGDLATDTIVKHTRHWLHKGETDA